MTAVSIQGGLHHSAMLMSNGALYTCGNPANGRLGLSVLSQMAAMQDININEMPPVLTPHLVETCSPQPAMPFSQYVTYVACGDAHTLAITLAGELKAWGCNSHGQLGVGDRCVQDPVHIVNKKLVCQSRLDSLHMFFKS